MPEFPKAAIDHFNSKSEEILKLFEKVQPKGFKTPESKGSLKEKKPIVQFSNVGDLGMIGPNGIYATTSKSGLLGFLKPNSESEFTTFVNSIYKRAEINSMASYEFVRKTCFNWFREKFEKGHSVDFMAHLVKSIEDSCKNYMFIFPILYLDIHSNFTSGMTQINYFSEGLIQAFKNDGIIKEEEFERFKKEHLGQVYVSVSVINREQAKAKEIASHSCGLAMDVIKMFSPTIENPLSRCDFDLESKVKFNSGSHIMIMELKENESDRKFTPTGLTHSLINHARPFNINEAYFNHMLKNGYGHVSNFIAKPFDNEIGELVMNSIVFFSGAVSNRDLHKRIVELFTITESFLIKSEEEPILNSINKYFPKIIAKGYEDRNALKKILTELYGVRSAMVHHGKRKDIDLVNLSILQESVRALIISFIEIGEKQHKTKVSFLAEIDKAIDEAY